MDSYNTGADTGLIAIAVIVYVLIFAALYVWTALSLNAVFRKVGEPAWAGWVPYFNWAVLLKLGGFSPYLIFIVLVPYLGPLAIWVLFIIAAYRINAAFGYREGAGVGMTFLAALLLPVWSSVLGWGSARWVGPDPRLIAPATGYQQPGAGYAAQPGAYPAASGGYAPPAAPEGYIPPAPPAGYVPPAAPAGYVPPAPPASPPASPYAPAAPPADDAFAMFAAPTDEDLEGVDDPVPDAASASADIDTVADPRPSAAAAVPPVIDAVPASVATPPADPVDPWAPPAPVPAARRSPMPEDSADFSDTSAEVSAVEGAPRAGSPMAARSSVSAQRDEPELPDADAAFDETIVTPRHRTEWMLTPPLGAPIRLTSTVLILGRRPVADPAYPQAQLIDIADETRTVSKTHARLELVPTAAAGASGDEGPAEHWTITDLDSTNGVVLVADDGDETELPADGSHPVGERFRLGDAELRLTRGQD